jgi:hypothetical protein
MRVLLPSLLAAATIAAAPASATADGMGDMAPYPDLAHASRTDVTQARRLWHGTLVAAGHHFPSWSAARAAGYVTLGIHPRRPVIYHLRKRAYETDGAVLDPRPPEALVYWLPRHGSPVLLGFMYRVLAGRPPAFGGDIFAYHRHSESGHMGATQMTHVWLAHSLRSAYARCLPVAALERAIPAFHYAETAHRERHPESAPCKEM